MLLMIFIALVHVAYKCTYMTLPYVCALCALCIGVFRRVVEMGDTERRH